MAAKERQNGSGGPKAAEVVADRVRAMIARGDLKPGDALPSETALMEQFGVARPTMREAIRVLESDGLIRIQLGMYGGARVQELDLDLLARRAGLYLQMHGTTMRDLVEAQNVVEPGTVRLAAQRRRKRDVIDLRQLVEDVRTSSTADDFADAAAEFHLALFRVSGNRTLGMFARLIQQLLHEEYRNRLAKVAPKLWHVARDSAAEWYPRLVDLIEAGDADAAEELWIRQREMAGEAGRFLDSRGREPFRLFP